MERPDYSLLQNFQQAIQCEWLETNGLGGWSSTTIIGCHSRRYHGLLVAATHPPTERTSLLSKLDETIVTGGGRFELGCNFYRNNTIYPSGYLLLQNFERDLFPEWTYLAGGIQIKKTVAMVYEENTTLILYEVQKAEASFQLELVPFISARNCHSLQHESSDLWWDVQFENGIFRNQPGREFPNIFISVPGATYEHNPCWYYKFNYPAEAFRGLDFEEDLFNPGRMKVDLKQGDCLGIIVSTLDPSGRAAPELFQKEKERKQSLLINQSIEKSWPLLVLASDQFIVRRGEKLKTVIAGYHWFTDWGRDTMISLPGLCLSTGRYEDARKILAAFAQSVNMGMLPNRFADQGDVPTYNNVDATLWYFVAIYKYLLASNDKNFVLSELLPVLKGIIRWHQIGTRFNIHEDEDGLLSAGEVGQQLTWMDAKIGDWVVTPRMGKPVEIQSLWYNALRIFAELLIENGELPEAEKYETLASKAKFSFLQKFWYAEKCYLYDTLDENGNPDASLRPNQLFAISLPFSLLESDKAEAVFRIVAEKLYTPVGLRSLSADDKRYVPQYVGDLYKRDSSYHQGTVWGWLIGPYVDALVKITGSKDKARVAIEKMKDHLNQGCLGSISEIFDAEAPHLPRGCVAQAWSVAEIARVIWEYNLWE
jgi:predicted glycogen debranching enzyme